MMATTRLKDAGRKITINLLSKLFAQAQSIPILWGPLKGRRLPKGAALQNPRMLFGGYEPETVGGILSTPDPLKVAYDVGAHVGLMTLALAERVGQKGKVFSFEPCPTTRSLIEELVVHNHLTGVVRVMDVALAELNGGQNLFLGKNSFMNFLEGAWDGQPIKNRKAIPVRTATMDSFIYDNLNPPPDLLKIDVEGAEALVIQGGLKTIKAFSPRIIIEIHGPRNAQKTWGLLQGLNYRWSWVRGAARQSVPDEANLLSLFREDCWVHHFLLTRES